MGSGAVEGVFVLGESSSQKSTSVPFLGAFERSVDFAFFDFFVLHFGLFGDFKALALFTFMSAVSAREL